MGTVGNLNIKAAAVIDSCLLIFQTLPMLLHHRQSLSLCHGKKKRQLRGGDVAVGSLGRHLQAAAWGGDGEA